MLFESDRLLVRRLTEEDTENGVSLNGRMEMDDDRT